MSYYHMIEQCQLDSLNTFIGMVAALGVLVRLEDFRVNRLLECARRLLFEGLHPNVYSVIQGFEVNTVVRI